MKHMDDINWSKVLLYTVIIIVVLFLLGWLLAILGVFGPRNAGKSYSQFRELKTTYDSQVANIALYKKSLNDEKNAEERHRMHVDLEGQMTMCNNTVQAYNAQSMKVYKNIYKLSNGELPDRLSFEGCK
jgi:hypothetical protein